MGIEVSLHITSPPSFNRRNVVHIRPAQRSYHLMRAQSYKNQAKEENEKQTSNGEIKKVRTGCQKSQHAHLNERVNLVNTGGRMRRTW